VCEGEKRTEEFMSTSTPEIQQTYNKVNKKQVNNLFYQNSALHSSTVIRRIVLVSLGNDPSNVSVCVSVCVCVCVFARVCVCD